VPSYSWTISSGTLPTGLYLAANTGVISGTPTSTSGVITFTVQVTDVNGAIATRVLSITIAGSIAITTTSLVNGISGVAYSQPVNFTGGNSPFTWTISVGTLPTGYTIGTNTGIISGTSTSTGVHTFTVHVVDSLGNIATQALSINILSLAPPTGLTIFIVQ
jgi:hypothetical protein